MDIAAKLIEGLTKQIQNIRKQDFEASASAAEEIGVKNDFPEKRRRRVRRRDMDESVDENYDITPKQNFKLAMFEVLDRLVNHFQWRFEKLNTLSKNFSFLSIYGLKRTEMETLKKTSQTFG